MVCVSVILMFGMGFVSLCVCRPYVWHGVCLFVCLSSLCLAWGLPLRVSVVLMFGMGFVCLCVCHPYVWHGVCLFVCLSSLCLALGLSVCVSVSLMFVEGRDICNKQS